MAKPIGQFHFKPKYSSHNSYGFGVASGGVGAVPRCASRSMWAAVSAEIEALLKRRPSVGQLFPYLCTVRAGDRATEFKQRCDGLGISGVSLHSYRYAWAERALKCGFPERFAQQALGHNSKAVHRDYPRTES